MITVYYILNEPSLRPDERFVLAIIGVAFVLVLGAAVGRIWRNRPWAGAGLALLFDWLGLALVGLLKDARPKCHLCGGLIDPSKPICRHCGRETRRPSF